MVTCKIFPGVKQGSLLPAQKVYHELLNESEGGPKHVILTPKDPTQINNFRKPLAAEAKLS